MPQVGIISKVNESVNSIEMAVWVAAGGRGTLIGAILGAGFNQCGAAHFTVAAPEIAWLLILGALFIVVTVPKGVIGLFDRFLKGGAIK